MIFHKNGAIRFNQLLLLCLYTVDCLRHQRRAQTNIHSTSRRAPFIEYHYYDKNIIRAASSQLMGSFTCHLVNWLWQKWSLLQLVSSIWDDTPLQPPLSSLTPMVGDWLVFPRSIVVNIPKDLVFSLSKRDTENAYFVRLCSLSFKIYMYIYSGNPRCYLIWK